LKLQGDPFLTVTTFDARLAEAISDIGNRLQMVCNQFGPTDFPRDNGIGFRNELIKVPLAFANEVKNPEETDQWFEKNIPLLERLEVHQLVRVIGTMHFHIATCDVVAGRTSKPVYRTLLDWILNTYDFRGTEAQEWFAIAKEGHEGERKMYAEIAAILGADSNDETNAGAWSGMALILAHGHEWDAKEHSAFCAAFFDS
jgi:hypothetical protein